jgi:FixJ family two-component response regulator
VKASSEQKTVDRRLIVVVDDDESVRESLPDLLEMCGFTAITFSSAEEFIASDSVDRALCLLLDIAMPGMNGLDLQIELKSRGCRIPIVFVTAQRDESVRARALEQGAVDVLFKPFSDLALQEALNKAMDDR